jgi:hypothetical protein
MIEDPTERTIQWKSESEFANRLIYKKLKGKNNNMWKDYYINKKASGCGPYFQGTFHFNNSQKSKFQKFGNRIIRE